MQNKLYRQGFTLIELLVALGVFSILVAIGVGGFAHVLHTQREVVSLISTQSNASVALEQMAREIRTGYLFCDKPGNDDPSATKRAQTCQWRADVNLPGQFDGCVTPGGVWTCQNILNFYNAQATDVDYRLANGTLQRSDSGANGYVSLTSDDVSVKYLTFTILGNTEGDHWPPRITISMGIVPSSTDPALENDVLNLQTTVSAREIDCTPGGTPSC